MAKCLIDRTQLPYDAMVADASWLGIEKEGEEDDGGTETEKIQTDQI